METTKTKKTMNVQDLLNWLNEAVDNDKTVLKCRVVNFHGNNELKACISVAGQMKDGTLGGTLLLCFEK